MKYKNFIQTLIIGIIISLLFGFGSSVYAQYTGYAAGTAYQIVNISNSPSTITVSYYNERGEKILTRTFTDVEPNGSRLVLVPRDETNLGSGRFSAVIESTGETAAVVNQEFIVNGNVNQPQPPFASYSAVKGGGKSVFLPGIMYNYFGYYTEIYIQNVGDGDATDVKIEYIPSVVNGVLVGQKYTESNINIKQYASASRSQQSMAQLGAPESSGIFTGRFFGSAVITSSKDIAVVVNQHNTTQKKMFSYNGVSNGSTRLISPTALRGWYSYYTALTIVNMSQSEKACVRLTYYPDITMASNITRVDGSSNLDPVVKEFVIDPKNALLRYEGDDASDSQSDLKATYTRFSGSVIIESFNGTVQGVNCSEQPLAAIMNVEAKAGANYRNQAGAFNVIDINSATNKVIVPVVLANWYGYYTVINLANTTATAATCDITYTSGPGSTVGTGVSKTYTRVLPSNGAIMIYEGNPINPDSRSDINRDPFWKGSSSVTRFLGSAVIECKDSQNNPVNVVAFVNEEVDRNGVDSMYTFNTINK